MTRKAFVVFVLAAFLVLGCIQTGSSASPSPIFSNPTAVSSAAPSKTPEQGPSSDLVQSGLNDSFQLIIGQTGVINEGEALLKFTNVTEDSRCPKRVLCHWEGRATVALQFIADGKTENLNLTSRAAHANLAKKTVLGYQLELLELEPYPQSIESIPKYEYKASFKISAN